MSLIGRKVIGTVAYLGGIMAIPEPFVKAWSEMIQYNYEYLLKPTERILYTRSTVSYHSFARDSIIDEMQGDFVLMLDCDVIFEPDVVAQMLHKMEYHNIDVLTGLYPYKGPLNAPVLYGYDKKRKDRFIIGDWEDNVDVFPIDSAGGGCLMIRKSVVDRIKARGESLFAIKGAYSEDISFFQRLKDLKIKAYCSPSIRLEHLKYQGLSIDKDYPRSKRKGLVKRMPDVDGFR